MVENPTPNTTLKRKHDDLAEYFKDIGLTRLARDIRHEKYLWDRWLFEVDFLERREERIQELVLSAQTQAFEKAKSYNNIIITLGYAGTFAIWNLVNDQLWEFDRALIAVLLGISLAIFIIWTLISNIVTTKFSHRAMMISADDYEDRDKFLEALERHEIWLTKVTARHMRYYHYAFYFAVTFGISAMLLLLIIMAAQLFGCDLSTPKVIMWCLTTFNS